MVLVLHGFMTPQPPEPDKQAPAEKADVAVAQPQAGDEEDPPAVAAVEAPVDGILDAKQDAEPVAEVPLEYVSLGSVDEESPYRLLVTLSNRGAGVERVELANSRYRDLHDRGGYLGHLELKADPAGGLLAQVVGAGTPAAAAGLESGDRIVAASGKSEAPSLNTLAEFKAFLAQEKPGATVTLRVARGDAAPIDLTASLTRRPLDLIRPEAENVLMREDKLPSDFDDQPSFQFTFAQLGTTSLSKLIKQAKQAAAGALADGLGEEIKIPDEIAGLELRDGNWEVAEHDEDSVTFRQRLPEYNLEVLKRYRLKRVPEEELSNADYPGYDFELELEIRNLGGEPLAIAYQLDGPNGLPLEGWWYANKIGRAWSGVGIRDVVARYDGSDTIQDGPTNIAKGEIEPVLGQPLAFIGVDAQYFSAMLLPQKPTLDTTWIGETRTILIGHKPKARGAEGRFSNVTCRLISKTTNLAAGASLKHSYTVFTGPKRPELLAKYHASEDPFYSLSDLLYYGWFSKVAKAMLWILHTFYGIVGNYGISIILLTVLVRSCLFPISRKQALSMARMQELRPEMDKLKEKYKSDMQKQSQAMQELYRKHKINPMAGCLPMFIQLPILLGLYRALMVDVELRQAPLLGENIRWCSNLASPDMLWDWSSVMPDFVTNGIGMLSPGPYLNILPLITCSLFILQQKMFMPEPANEQAAMQQKIMKYMMVLMGFMFFKVASGLCIYFIASSLWGIGERKLVPPASAKTGIASGPDTDNLSSSRSSSEKNGQSKRKGKRSGKSKKKR